MRLIVTKLSVGIWAAAYIKNTIGAVAEELGAEGYNTDRNKKRNEGSYIMDSSYSDMEKLLNRSRTLADQSGKEAQ